MTKFGFAIAALCGFLAGCETTGLNTMRCTPANGGPTTVIQTYGRIWGSDYGLWRYHDKNGGVVFYMQQSGEICESDW